MAIALALTLGFAIGLLMGVLGSGGAILAVPVLVGLLGQDPHAATTASLVVVGAAAGAAALRHARSDTICWRVALILGGAAIPGALLGTWANATVDGSVLLVCLAVLLVGVAVVTWRRSRSGGGESEAPVPACPALATGPLVATGAVVGVLTGFLGIGGGFLIIPALAVALHVPFRRAIATSLVVVVLASTVSLAAHLLAGAEVDWPLTLVFAAATAAGGSAGAMWSRRIPTPVLTRAFAVLLVGVALATLAAL